MLLGQMLYRFFFLILSRDTDSRRIALAMPKFSYSGNYEMTSSLQSLGMVDAFSDQSADFSGMTDADAFISQVVHKTVIDVNEVIWHSKQ